MRDIITITILLAAYKLLDCLDRSWFYVFLPLIAMLLLWIVLFAQVVYKTSFKPWRRGKLGTSFD